MICGTSTALNTPPATSRKIRLGRLLALINVSLTVEPRPSAAPSIQVLPKPRKRDTSVPAAMMALERVSLAPVGTLGSVGTLDSLGPGCPARVGSSAGATGPEAGPVEPVRPALLEGGLEADIEFIVSPGHCLFGTGPFRSKASAGPGVRQLAQRCSGRTSRARSAMRRSLGKESFRASSRMGTHATSTASWSGSFSIVSSPPVARSR